LIYFQLGTDQVAVQDRTGNNTHSTFVFSVSQSLSFFVGVLFFIMINQGFGTMFQVLNAFLEERIIFQKERFQGKKRDSL
jgi:hypothetical protein